MPRIALIVVDLQEDFLPRGPLGVVDGRSIIPTINNLVTNDLFSAVVATQDWHPTDHISFSSQHNVHPFTELEFKNPEDDHKTKTLTSWPDHCVQDTPGACLEASFTGCFNSIAPHIPRAVVKKGYLADREYYSCFKDVWGLHHTELESFLRENKIDTVVLVGIAYDFCVLSSALDAAAFGFDTIVLSDCTKSVYPEKFRETSEQYQQGGVKLLSSEQFLGMHRIV